MEPHTMLRLRRKSPGTFNSARTLESGNDQKEHLRPEGPQKMLSSNALRHLSDRDKCSEYGPLSHWNRGPIPASATYPAVTLGQGSIFLEPRLSFVKLTIMFDPILKAYAEYTCAKKPSEVLGT